MIETFELSELTQEFFDKLCYVEQVGSSGYFNLGEAGYILMVTEDGYEYLLGFEGYDEHAPQNTIPLLEIYEKWDEEERRYVYCAEDHGWTYIDYLDAGTDILIRDDVYEKMCCDDSEHDKPEYWDFYGLLEQVVKPEHGLQKKVYRKTKEACEEEARECRKIKEHREKVALTAEDIEWQPLHINNCSDNPVTGTYVFLFKKEEDGEVAGYKWTIEFQYEEIRHGRTQRNAPAEAYNLYFKEYRNVSGVMGYKKPGNNSFGRQCYEKSTLQDGVHSYGRFVRSYKTLERAKEAVLFWNGCIGWGLVDLENIIRVSMDEKSVANMEREYEKKTEEESRLDAEKDFKFKDIRDYISRIDRLSICMLETGGYENYIRMKDVPHSYDEYYVYGIGMIESEFYEEEKHIYTTNREQGALVFLYCMEIMLSKEPKSVLRKREEEEMENEKCSAQEKK